MLFNKPMKRAALLLALASMACLPSIVSAESVLTYDSSLSPVDGTSIFNRVSAVSVDEQGHEICVTDEGAAALYVFRTNLVQEFRTSRISGITWPCDAAIDAQGRFVLTDRIRGSGRTIKRLNRLGEPLPYEPEKPLEVWNPGHLLILRDGSYLTVDERTDLLVKHDSETGAILWQCSVGDPLRDTQAFFGRPVEAPDGRIFVPAGDFRRIFVLSPSGEVETSFGEEGSSRGKLTFPVGVALGPRGIVLVVDRLRHTVLVYDSAYRFIDEYAGFGDRPGGLYHPISIASLPDGRFCVAQGFRGRVQLFRLRQQLSGSDGAGVITNNSRTDDDLELPGSENGAPTQGLRHTDVAQDGGDQHHRRT
jgi:hypothetical protein